MAHDVYVKRGAYEGFPLFRMNSDMIKYWLLGGQLRRGLANTIAKTWKTGVVILNPNLYAIGTVTPNGVCTDLTPPFHKFEMWQICNKPSVRYNECACRGYYDPEVGGCWGERDKERGMDIHHPHCQFERTSQKGFNRAYKSGHARSAAGLNPQERPDEWIRTRQAILR